MSFPRYTGYKDSGVDWLGEVPAHWKLFSLRHCLVSLFNGLTAEQVDEAEETVPVTRIESISQGVIDFNRTGFIRRSDAKQVARLQPGDICFSNINSLNMIGNCALFEGEAEIYGGMNLLVLRPSADTFARWLYWLIRSGSFREEVESLAKPAINQASVSQTSLLGVRVPAPTIAEQRAIAAFLDRETAKIDALVAEQQRLIELLKEKRQAVISRAVTKGLNPNAPMKDSGVEWLGEVPAHWEVSQIGRLCEYLSYGFTNPMPTADEGPFMLTANDIDYGAIKYETARRTTYYAYQQLLTGKSRPIKDDILLTKDGTLGRVAVHDGQQACINQSVALLRPDAAMAYTYFMALALGEGVYQERMIYEAGGTTIKHIYISRLAKMPFALPPRAEQRAIWDRLADRLVAFSDLTKEAERAIELLRERRSALISAAVTGQIDVRGLAQAEAA